MKTLLHNTFPFILLLSMVALPVSVSASTIYIDSPHAEVFEGDTIVFAVRVNSEGKNINAVEGEVLLDHEAGAASLVDIGLAGSQFSLWPVTPVPSEHNTRIYFTGGSPGGFVSNDAIIFTIALKFNKTGLVSLSPDNSNVYVHDGKGTQDTARLKDLLISVLPREPGINPINDLQTLIANDTSAPLPFEIFAGQDNSIFDGKKFLSFSTTDTGSGISHYEVFEGTLPPVRSTHTYVLQEQTAPVTVTIIAYDAAGNARESVYTTTPETATSYITIAVVVGIIFLVIVFIMMFIKRRRLKNGRS